MDRAILVYQNEFFSKIKAEVAGSFLQLKYQRIDNGAII